MKTYRIKIETGNAAFENDPDMEIARILKRLAVHVEHCGADAPCKLMDINGNQVGTAVLK